MIDVARTFDVPAPLAAVVDYLRDWGNAREWDPGTVGRTQLSEDPIGVGTRWRNDLMFLRRPTVMEFRLESDDPTRLAFFGQNRTATSTDTMTFTPQGERSTSITYHAHVTFNGWSKLAQPLTRWELERLADALVLQMTAAIRRRSDRSDPSAPAHP